MRQLLLALILTAGVYGTQQHYPLPQQQPGPSPPPHQRPSAVVQQMLLHLGTSILYGVERDRDRQLPPSDQSGPGLVWPAAALPEASVMWRKLGAVVLTLCSCLMWTVSASANPFAHGYRITPSWAADADTLCRTYNQLVQKCIVEQACLEELPTVTSRRALALRMAQAIRKGGGPYAQAERRWLVDELVEKCPLVK